jgi:hypothetical protein
MADRGATIDISADVPPQEKEQLQSEMQKQIARGRIAPLSRQWDPETGAEGPLNINPYSIPTAKQPPTSPPESYDAHPIEHVARHAKGRTPPVR